MKITPQVPALAGMTPLGLKPSAPEKAKWHIGVRQPSSDKFIYGSKGEEIADCDMKTNFPDENLANARLIAHAPELLELLERINFVFYVKGTRKAMIEVMAETKPLLEKARGWRK
jgi:protein-disulfide isomerase-like protein with CxxC motif